MTRYILLFLALSLGSCVASTPALRILGISALPSKSHHIWFTHLMNGLARRGHEVHALSHWPTVFDDNSNRTHSTVFEGVIEKFQSSSYLDPIDWSQFSTTGIMFWVNDVSNEVCKMDMATEGAKQVLELVKNTKIDVILQDATSGQCFYAMREIAQGNPPLVAFTPFGMPDWVIDIVGGHNYPAIKSFTYYAEPPPFNLAQRTLNYLYYELSTLLRQFIYMPVQQEIGEKFIGQKLSKSLSAIESNIDKILTNSYPTLEPGIPVSPNVVEVGGLQIKQPKPLPNDIQTYLDGSEHGAVVISLGTNVQSHRLPTEKLHAILEALAQLKQRVLWKFGTPETQLPNKSDNVMIKSWIPQSDVLAHPKVRAAFIHGGLLSTQEAIWHGVPFIGMPFFMDQYVNIEQLVRKGAAVQLDYDTLTSKKILDAFTEILNDTSYARNMAQISWDYRDRATSPLELAIWHVEHAARHPRGVLSSPVRELSRIQLHLLDVYAFLICILLLVFWMLSWFVGSMYKLFSSSRNSVTDVKQKHH